MSIPTFRGKGGEDGCLLMPVTNPVSNPVKLLHLSGPSQLQVSASTSLLQTGLPQHSKYGSPLFPVFSTTTQCFPTSKCFSQSRVTLFAFCYLPRAGATYLSPALCWPSATWWALRRLEEKVEQDGREDGREDFCL